MTREALLEQLLIEGAMPGPLPGVPYDSPTVQAARVKALLEEVRAFDRYSAGQRNRRQRRTVPVPKDARPRCANCGSHKIEPVRVVVAA